LKQRFAADPLRPLAPRALASSTSIAVPWRPPIWPYRTAGGGVSMSAAAGALLEFLKSPLDKGPRWSRQKGRLTMLALENTRCTLMSVLECCLGRRRRHGLQEPSPFRLALDQLAIDGADHHSVIEDHIVVFARWAGVPSHDAVVRAETGGVPVAGQRIS
jgi:hypothetical protein